MDLDLHKDGSVSNLMSFEEIRSEIKPFDLIAFRGGDLASELISVFEKYEVGVGNFTHVGMIVTADILPFCKKVDGEKFELDPNKLYLYQSTFTYTVPYIVDGVQDVTTGKGFFGVQLCDMEEVIPNYISSKTTKVAYCKLIDNPWESHKGENDEDLKIRRAKLTSDFQNFFEEYQGRMYEMDPLSLLSAMFPTLRSIRDYQDKLTHKLVKKLNKWGFRIKENSNYTPSGWQFCSELVSNVYKLIGILPESLNAENILPIAFFGFSNTSDLPQGRSLVCAPVYIKDWSIPGKEETEY
jgi:hypothetical protein